MYEDNKVSINWFKIGLKLLIVILLIILFVKILGIAKDNKAEEAQNAKMTEKLEQLEEVGKKYFTDDKLPKNVGESVQVSLEKLIEEKYSNEIKDEEDNLCDATKSNIKITKLDNEYQLKTTLSCPNYDNYINTFINIEEEVIPITENVTTTKKVKTTTTTKKVTTTKATTTTVITTTVPKNKYKVSFNTNGGALIDDQYVSKNGVIISPGSPVRAGYKFVGWYYHGEKFDLNTKINQDYVLVAKWIKA